MAHTIVRTFRVLAWPALLPLIGAVFWLGSASAPISVTELWELLPIVLFGSALALGWRFNRSRVFLASLIICVSVHALQVWSTSQGLWAAVTILVPLNLAWLAVLRERGFLTVHGFIRATVLAAQVGGIIWLCLPKQAWISSFLTRPLIELEILTKIEEMGLPQTALFSLIISTPVLIWQLLRRRTAIESALLGGLAAFLLAILSPLDGIAFLVYISTAGLILTLAVIENSYSLAFNDELTGIPGRRAMNEALRKLSSRYTLAMVDIDHFKRFNDRYGHDIGDEALRMVASRLTRLGGGGRAYRYGGEEFALIFPGKTLETALPHIENMRRVIADSSFTIRGRGRPSKKPAGKKSARRLNKHAKLTVSIGVAESSSKHSAPDDVIKAADKALYKAKRAGRNRVINK